MSVFGAVEEVAAAGVVIQGIHTIGQTQRRAQRRRPAKKKAKKRSKSRGR